MSHLEQILVNRRYQLLEKIGEGGMGAVYKATDRLVGTTIALKQVTTSATNLMFNSLEDKDSVALASVLINIGETYISGVRGTRGEGLVYFEKARPLCEAIGDKQGLAHIETGIGHMRYIRGEYDTAKIHTQRATVQTLVSLAKGHLHSNELDDVIHVATEAINTAKAMNVLDMKAEAHYILATAYSRRQDWERTHTELENARTILQQLDIPILDWRVYYALAENYQHLGNTEGAQKAFDMSNQLEKVLSEQIGELALQNARQFL